MTPEKIRAFRKSKHLTQTELGELCGVTKASVSGWEIGRTQPSGAALRLLKEYMLGQRCILPLTAGEEALLDEAVRKGNYADREAFLSASLLHLIKHGKF